MLHLSDVIVLCGVLALFSNRFPLNWFLKCCIFRNLPQVKDTHLTTLAWEKNRGKLLKWIYVYVYCQMLDFILHRWFCISHMSLCSADGIWYLCSNDGFMFPMASYPNKFNILLLVTFNFMFHWWFCISHMSLCSTGGICHNIGIMLQWWINVPDGFISQYV